MSSRVQTVVAAVLAVVGPALVAVGFFQALLSYRDAEDAMAERNAGRIVNATVVQRGVVPAMEALLAQREPEVLILGPSYANTDVRPELLAQRLGVRKDKVVLLSVPNSVGSHWYAVLAHRVFGNGHRPRLVVMVSGLQSMLLATPLTESSFVNLEAQLPPEGDPVVAAKVQGSTSLWWARVREQRGKVRARLFDVLRRPVGLFLDSSRGGGRMGPIETRVNLEAVFDDSRVDMSLHTNSTPVVEANRGQERFYTADMLPDPPDSFMPDITALAAEHGARVVWVRPPMSPHIPEYLDDVVAPGVQEQAIATVEALGGDYVDMRGLPMTSAMFKNEDHMNEEGSRRFSQALAQALLDLDAMHPVADPEAAGPLAFEVSTEGDTRMWSVTDAWDARRGTFEASVVLDVPRDTEPDSVAVVVAGRAVKLRPFPMAGERTLLRGRVRPEAPDGPFEVTVTAGADVELVGLALGRRRGRVFLVGDAEALDGVAAPLFGVVQVVDGVRVDQTVRPEYLSPPVSPPNARRPVTDLPGTKVAAFETERWAFLSDEALQGETTFGSRCSPLRIAEDDAVLEGANVPCLEVKREGGGRSCHTPERIFFTASDDTDPASNGRDYRMVLDEGRRCDSAVWLYPVDHFRVAWSDEAVAGLKGRAQYLTLRAKYLNNRPAEIQVKLLVDGEAWIDEAVQGRDFKTEDRVWRLDRPIPADAEVVLDVENLEHTFYLMTGATLSERPPAVR